MLKQSTKFAANRSKRRQNFNGSGSAMLLFRFSHIHGRLFKSLRRVYVVRYWLKIFVFIDGRRCVFDPSKLQFAKLQIDVDKFLSASVNEHKDYQLISFNIHIL